jgi:hypothetical protein
MTSESKAAQTFPWNQDGGRGIHGVKKAFDTVDSIGRFNLLHKDKVTIESNPINLHGRTTFNQSKNAFGSRKDIEDITGLYNHAITLSQGRRVQPRQHTRTSPQPQTLSDSNNNANLDNLCVAGCVANL